MKRSCFFLAMILGPVSIWGTSYGDPSSAPASASSAKTSDRQNASNLPNETQDKTTKPNPTAQGSPQVDDDQKKSKKVTGKNEQVNPGATPSVTKVKPGAGPLVNAAAAKPINVGPIHNPAFRPSTVVAPPAPAVKNERHLGANAAVVGAPAKTFGQTRTNVANAGINGTGLNQKH